MQILLDKEFEKIKLKIDFDLRKVLTEKNLEELSDKFYYPFPKFDGDAKRSVKVGRCKVNVYSASCSCKVFRENVKKYKKRDIRRFCLHLYTFIFKEYYNKLDTLTQLLLDSNFWLGQKHFFEVKYRSGHFYIGFNKSMSKAYFYIKKGEWQRFVYDFENDQYLGWEESEGVIYLNAFKKYLLSHKRVLDEVKI